MNAFCPTVLGGKACSLSVAKKGKRKTGALAGRLAFQADGARVAFSVFSAVVSFGSFSR